VNFPPSTLTPLICVTCLDALEGLVIDWLKKKGFDFVDVDVGFGEAKDLGVNLVSLGGGRVHCFCQALKRDPVQV